MNSATCRVAVPPSNSTADSPTGVKLRQAVAAALCGSVPIVTNNGSRLPSHAPAASRCSTSDTISVVPRLPPSAPAWPSIGWTARAIAARTAAMAVPARHGPSNGQHDQQQDAAHQQPLPELCPQRDHRHGVQRHRDAAGAGDHRALHHQPCHADHQGECCADARKTQQPPSQERRFGGRLCHGGGRHQGEEHQRAEQRHQRRDVRAAEQSHDDFDYAHPLTRERTSKTVPERPRSFIRVEISKQNCRGGDQIRLRRCGRRRSQVRNPATAMLAIAGNSRGCNRSGSNALMRRPFSW